MSFEWDKTKSAAMKILGKDGDVPDPPSPMDAALKTFDKTFEDFNKSRDDIEAKILAMENANDGIKNIMKQFQASLAKADLGLDPKNKDDAKKIAQARKILLDRIADANKRHDTNEKILDELDKHVIQLQKYKPPPL